MYFECNFCFTEIPAVIDVAASEGNHSATVNSTVVSATAVNSTAVNATAVNPTDFNINATSEAFNNMTSSSDDDAKIGPNNDAVETGDFRQVLVMSGRLVH